MKRIVVLLVAIAALVPGAAIASANSTSCSYGQCTVHHVIHTRHSPTTTSRGPDSPCPSCQVDSNSATKPTVEADSGSLPFTGLDIGALAAGAVVLIGAGLFVRRLTANPHRGS